MHKDIRKIVKELESRGYTVVRENGRYLKVRNANGDLVYALPATPGRGRWRQNLQAELRRRGLLD